MLETGLADELAAHITDAIRAIVNPMKSFINLLESLVLFAHLTEVLEAHERVGSVLILADAVVGLLKGDAAQRLGLSQSLLPQQDETTPELVEVGL